MMCQSLSLLLKAKHVMGHNPLKDRIKACKGKKGKPLLHIIWNYDAIAKYMAKVRVSEPESTQSEVHTYPFQ